jgi:hypothetical protein
MGSKVTKSKITKAELIREIKEKVKRANPMVKRHFYRLLARSTKPELVKIRKKVRVSRDGYDISFV